jgi:HD superfamily phosphohydrolase
MTKVVTSLRNKGVDITPEEEQALQIAILLHDIGHGPFSHALEGIFSAGKSHEELTLQFMYRLNDIFSGKLDTALEIFTGKYPKKFFKSLISGQLDMDRLDYLKRDSFYTGVVEGSINSDRLIAMMNVSNGELVIEHKGLYSIEKFLLSRRFMYWQVYFHKTGLLAEKLLFKVLQRAGSLPDLSTREPLTFFLKEDLNTHSEDVILERFSKLDDTDIWVALKNWMQHPDKVLSDLSKMLIYRKLPHIEFSDKPFAAEYIAQKKQWTRTVIQSNDDDIDYYIWEGKIGSTVYDISEGGIGILSKNGEVNEWLDVVKQFDKQRFTNPYFQYYLVYPRA